MTEPLPTSDTGVTPNAQNHYHAVTNARINEHEARLASVDPMIYGIHPDMVRPAVSGSLWWIGVTAPVNARPMDVVILRDPPTTPPLPPAPGGLAANVVGTNATLSWNPEPSAHNYEYRVNGGTPVSTGTTTGATVAVGSYTVTDFEVRTVDVWGALSAWSTKVIAFGAGTRLASDNFTGADVADVNGRATDNALGGTVRTWVRATGGARLGVLNQEGYRAVGGTSNAHGFDVGSGDVVVQVRFLQIADSTHYVYARQPAVTTATHYMAAVTPTTVRLGKQVAGVYTEIGAVPQAWDASKTVGLRVIGTTVQLLLNGVVVDTVTDTAIAATGLIAGLKIGGAATTMRVDYIIVHAA